MATAVAAAAAAAKPSPSVDPMCTLRGAAVHEDFSAMLNQTNVGANNNKFYRVQLLDGAPPAVCVSVCTPHCTAA